MKEQNYFIVREDLPRFYIIQEYADNIETGKYNQVSEEEFVD
jgi:hypothetical protein